ncbi:class I SAM-dependent methyltransferase [Streptomyces nanshensis]|uniref:Methyltransferase type 11 domain-containing protein n=1 Tax=Streptomyces nanshensis TaxID=518642 RepID=A0A1E7KZ77_9ACTN|nr:methyltransferase domain-containing protein [Streptomyces nanshensis]OEV09229.1 hypothetical protein AN218_22420 [Streptomyces nanshensis]
MTQPATTLPATPVSSFYGYDRGTPIDRHYIRQFLAEHAHLIRGHAAEIKDDTYVRTLGTGVSTTVIDIDPANESATLHADLTAPGALPEATFDVVVLTHTLQLLAAPGTALANCYRALVPGGALLLTAPTVGQLSLTTPGSDYWRLTPPGLVRLLSGWEGEVTVNGAGNLTACLAMLLGHAAEELAPGALDHDDPGYPLISCALATKPR